MSQDNLVEYTQFMDGVVKTFVSDILEKPELFDLITTYVENIEMRNINIILGIFYRKDHSQLLLNHLPDTLTNYILNERESTSLIVKNYDDTHFDPRKQNILHPHKENLDDITSIQNILAESKLTEEEYY